MKVGVALAGGGLKGVAYIGALKAFEELGIQIDYISGTSSGSMAAVLYSIGCAPEEMKKIIYESYKELVKIPKKPIISSVGTYITKKQLKLEGLISGERVENLIQTSAEEKNYKNINEINSFRTAPVFIMGAEHIPPDAADVPRLINELIYTSFKSDDFLYDLADFHIRYERIHPFGDGNGRSGRVLLNKIALCEGYAPFVIPKEERTKYMNLLADCNIEGLKKMIERLMNIEIERMKQFNIYFKEY